MKISYIAFFAVLMLCLIGCSSGSSGGSSSSSSGEDWSGVYYFSQTDDSEAPLLVIINSTSDVYSSLFSHTGGSYVATDAAFTLTLTHNDGDDLIFTVDAEGSFTFSSGDFSGTGDISVVEDRSALEGSWSGNIDNTDGNSPENKSVSFTVDSTGALSSITGLTAPYTGSYAFLDEFNKVRIIIRTAATDEWVFVNLGTGTGANSSSSSLVGTQVELDNDPETESGSSGTFSFSLPLKVIIPQSNN